MSLQCPSCSTLIASEDVNVSTDIAFCRSCSQSHRLSAITEQGSFGPTPQLDKPPPGAWYRDDNIEQVVGATLRSPAAIFLVPFTIVWSGGSMGVIYGQQILTGKFNLMTSIFGVPFLIGSLVLWCVSLLAIWGKVEVRVRENEGVIFTGVGGLGYRRRFDVVQVARVMESFGRWSTESKGPVRAIVLEGSTRIVFGEGINEPRRYFIIHALRQMLAVS